MTRPRRFLIDAVENPDAPEHRRWIAKVELPDGRTGRVIGYDAGSIIEHTSEGLFVVGTCEGDGCEEPSDFRCEVCGAVTCGSCDELDPVYFDHVHSDHFDPNSPAVRQQARFRALWDRYGLLIRDEEYWPRGIGLTADKSRLADWVEHQDFRCAFVLARPPMPLCGAVVVAYDVRDVIDTEDVRRWVGLMELPEIEAGILVTEGDVTAGAVELIAGLGPHLTVWRSVPVTKPGRLCTKARVRIDAETGAHELRAEIDVEAGECVYENVVTGVVSAVPFPARLPFDKVH